MRSGESLLEVEGLRVQFPGAARPAVRNLDFRIDAGECLGLVGASGSGKSLTALALTGLVPPPALVTFRRLRFAGEEYAGADEARYRSIRGKGIAYVFQEPLSALNPVLTVGDQMIEVLRTHERLSRVAARARADELLALVELSAATAFDAFPHELSGGQRQRAMLAIALSGAPRLLVADEPTTALDGLLTAAVLDALAALRRRLGLALLLISHETSVVSRLADRLLRLRRGEEVEDDAGGGRDPRAELADDSGSPSP